VGAYLKAKAQAESIVTSSGIEHTIFRPSAFDGEGHRAPPLLGPITRTLGLHKWRPITVDDLAQAILRCAANRAPLGMLEGRSLFDAVDAAKR
jgi:uncharacterized protein YbjT (DUF2867 family)